MMAALRAIGVIALALMGLAAWAFLLWPALPWLGALGMFVELLVARYPALTLVVAGGCFLLWGEHPLARAGRRVALALGGIGALVTWAWACARTGVLGA